MSSYTATNSVVTVVFSIAAVILQLRYLALYRDNAASYIALFALVAMFIVPMIKSYYISFGLQETWTWIFIVTSLVSLGAQGYIYGNAMGHNYEGLVAISVVLTVIASYTGHFMKNKFKEEEDFEFGIKKAKSNYMFYSFVQFAATLLPVILIIIWSQIDGYPESLTIIFIITLASLLFYASFSMVTAFVSPVTLFKYESYWICSSKDSAQSILEWIRDSKPVKIMLSAIIYAGLTIIYGNTENVYDLVNIIIFTVALVAEHINALYYKKKYFKSVVGDRTVTFE